jgi:hypothetical protein
LDDVSQRSGFLKLTLDFFVIIVIMIVRRFVNTTLDMKNRRTLSEIMKICIEPVHMSSLWGLSDPRSESGGGLKSMEKSGRKSFRARTGDRSVEMSDKS